MLGSLATGLGMAGVVLPLLPATPFLLLATFAFARSSPRLHAWLVEHPRLGAPINDWNKYGAINRRAKVLAMAVMAATALLSLVSGMRWEFMAMQLALMGGAAAFILTRPDGPNVDA